MAECIMRYLLPKYFRRRYYDAYIEEINRRSGPESPNWPKELRDYVNRQYKQCREYWRIDCIDK